MNSKLHAVNYGFLKSDEILHKFFVWWNNYAFLFAFMLFLIFFLFSLPFFILKVKCFHIYMNYIMQTSGVKETGPPSLSHVTPMISDVS